MEFRLKLDKKTSCLKYYDRNKSIMVGVLSDLSQKIAAVWFDLNNLHLKPLQDLAMRKLAVSLCTQRKVLSYAVEMDSAARRRKEHETTMYDLLKDLLPEVPLAQTLKDELFSVMKSVSREIIKWLDLHEKYLGPCSQNEIGNLELLCWTSLGSVDYRKTAEALISNEKLDTTQRYKLACLYCFEEDIRELWRKMPEKSQKSFYNIKYENLEQPDLVIIWTFILTGQARKILLCLERKDDFYHSINHLAFECAATGGFRTAAQYFHEKLTFEERDEVVVNAAMSVARRRSKDYYFYIEERQQLGDVLCYLMSVMQPYDLHNLLDNYTCETFKCVMDWPRQDAFIELAKFTHPYLSMVAYVRVLFNLTRNTSWGSMHSKIFREFLMIETDNFVLALLFYCDILRYFIRSDDIETVKFLFSHLDSQARGERIVGSVGTLINYELFKEGKWDFRTQFIEDAARYASERRWNVKFYSQCRSLPAKEEDLQRILRHVTPLDEKKEEMELKTKRKRHMALKAVYARWINFIFR